ncbi:hypothetical protein MNKW57_23950 [Biformimicrobium ophioploci]|uniref:Glycine zipper 2TM domain-containing protein n=2 Tax=Biformimicrobium ophioploci TaxID=3036711 RepID=A0ABQ6M131_9GAMM|nr:hypothetical protein MNKW57_23950 [Microbulbifer sp. NKW57]
MIDTRGVNMASYQRDLADCRMYAYNARRSQGGRAAGGAIGGALAGGALGAIVGNSGTAKRAAGAGALIGGISGAGSAVRDENVIVRRCLAGRGYRVLN